MARPPEPEKRLMLARRAVSVLAREGLDVSMSALADALEIKRPTLLYHFPTRADLVEAALEDLLMEQAAFVLPRVVEESHPLRQLHAQLRAVHAFHDGNESRIVFLTQAVAACAGPRLDAIIDAGNRVFEPWRNALAERIRASIHEGTTRPCDVDALMALTRSIIDGLLVQRVMTGLKLAPVHAFFWAHVLEPLVVKPEQRI